MGANATNSVRGGVADVLVQAGARVAVRAALVAGSLASGRLFWARAALGQNQLKMHDCTRTGEISIGGVKEQFFSEGFIAAWHDVLDRELGERAPAALYDVGNRGGRWEVEEAIRCRVWVPALLSGFIGKPELLEKVRTSTAYHALLEETLRILYRMIMTEGGWGVVERVDLRSEPARYEVSNTPESRQLGQTGRAVCHINAGIYAGHLSAIFGLPTRGNEVACVSRGDPRCVFEVRFEGDAP